MSVCWPPHWGGRQSAWRRRARPGYRISAARRAFSRRTRAASPTTGSAPSTWPVHTLGMCGRTRGRAIRRATRRRSPAWSTSPPCRSTGRAPSRRAGNCATPSRPATYGVAHRRIVSCRGRRRTASRSRATCCFGTPAIRPGRRKTPRNCGRFTRSASARSPAEVRFLQETPHQAVLNTRAKQSTPR